MQAKNRQHQQHSQQQHQQSSLNDATNSNNVHILNGYNKDNTTHQKTQPQAQPQQDTQSSPMSAPVHPSNTMTVNTHTSPISSSPPNHPLPSLLSITPSNSTSPTSAALPIDTTASPSTQGISVPSVTANANAVSHNTTNPTPSSLHNLPLSSSSSASNSTSTSPTSANPSAQYVFLGGSCDPTTWRHDIAIPKLQKYGITYYNPQLDDWHPDLIAAEAKAKEECTILLFVIDNRTRAIASMLEAVEYIMRNRSVVLVILEIEENTLIDGEQIGSRQLKDLNRARAFLCDIAARHQKNCDVFDSIESAINHIIWMHPSMQQHKLQKTVKRTSIIDTNKNNAITQQHGTVTVASPPSSKENIRPSSSSSSSTSAAAVSAGNNIVTNAT